MVPAAKVLTILTAHVLFYGEPAHTWYLLSLTPRIQMVLRREKNGEDGTLRKLPETSYSLFPFPSSSLQSPQFLRRSRRFRLHRARSSSLEFGNSLPRWLKSRALTLTQLRGMNPSPAAYLQRPAIHRKSIGIRCPRASGASRRGALPGEAADSRVVSPLLQAFLWIFVVCLSFSLYIDNGLELSFNYFWQFDANLQINLCTVIKRIYNIFSQHLRTFSIPFLVIWLINQHRIHLMWLLKHHGRG